MVETIGEETGLWGHLNASNPYWDALSGMGLAQ
jgi:hypothetical protein